MEKKKVFWVLMIGLAGSALGIVGVNLFYQNMMLLSRPVRAVAMIAVYWLIAASPIVVMRVCGDRLSDYGFAKQKVGLQLCMGVAVGLGLSALLTLLPHLVGLGAYVDSGKRYTQAWQFAYEFVQCTLAVGLVEEFVFRGFAYQKLELVFQKEWVAVLGSSLLFGLSHFWSGSLLQMGMTAGIGVLLCLCRKKLPHCTTLSLAVAHGVYDAMITVWGCWFA